MYQKPSKFCLYYCKIDRFFVKSESIGSKSNLIHFYKMFTKYSVFSKIKQASSSVQQKYNGNNKILGKYTPS